MNHFLVVISQIPFSILVSWAAWRQKRWKSVILLSLLVIFCGKFNFAVYLIIQWFIPVILSRSHAICKTLNLWYYGERIIKEFRLAQNPGGARQIDRRVCSAVKGVFFKIAELHCKSGNFSKSWKNQEMSDFFALKGLKILEKCTVRVKFQQFFATL